MLIPSMNSGQNSILMNCLRHGKQGRAGGNWRFDCWMTRCAVLMSPTGTEVLAEGAQSVWEPGDRSSGTRAGLLMGGISVGLGAGRMPRRNPEKREVQRETFQKCVLAESYQPELGECKVRFQEASGEEAGRTFQHCRCTAGNPESSSSSCLGEHRGLPIKPWGATPWA